MTRFTPTGVGTTAPSDRRLQFPKRFTPTGVGTTLIPTITPCLIYRFTPTGVGTTEEPAPLPIPLPRFTPTGVGTTRCASASAADIWRFTPTGVGTTRSRVPALGRFYGSPPRVWGQLPLAVPPPWTITVHPHGCGDNLQIEPLRETRTRFTPTGVGTTLRFLPILVGFDQQHPFYVY